MKASLELHFSVSCFLWRKGAKLPPIACIIPVQSFSVLPPELGWRTQKAYIIYCIILLKHTFFKEMYCIFTSVTFLVNCWNFIFALACSGWHSSVDTGVFRLGASWCLSVLQLCTLLKVENGVVSHQSVMMRCDLLKL